MRAMTICIKRNSFLSMLWLIMAFILFQPYTHAQTAKKAMSEDEQTIRGIIERANAGERLELTDSIIIVNPFLPSPQMGKQRTEAELKFWAEIKKERSNEKLIRNPQRIEIATAGDMAYEFGNYTVDYDSQSKQHIHNDGSYLNVWRKVNGKWMIEVIFNRYNQQRLFNQ